MNYKKITIYYMTGTGNSFRTASWMAETAREHGADARVVPHEEGRPEEEVNDEGDNMLGIVFPTHAFTAPWPVIRFAWRLPRRKNAHAFVIPTRGAVKVGRYFMPGGEFSAAYLIALILLLKGYSVRGFMGLDMPLNWMTLFPGMHPEKVESIAARAKEKATQFMTSILSGKRRCLSIGNIVMLLLGLLIFPISLAYLFVGRFFIAKLFFANHRCNGCGICVDNCPQGSLKMWGKKKPRPYWSLTCESCMRCMGYCPQEAVEGSQSFGVILYYVSMVPASVYLMNWLGNSWPQMGSIDNDYTRWILQYSYTLLSFVVAYFLFFHLIRIPFFNKLFTYTTFTHLYRRYHEPDTTLDDIQVKSKH